MQSGLRAKYRRPFEVFQVLLFAFDVGKTVIGPTGRKLSL
jgi:hypothetical protein